MHSIHAGGMHERGKRERGQRDERSVHVDTTRMHGDTGKVRWTAVWRHGTGDDSACEKGGEEGQRGRESPRQGSMHSCNITKERVAVGWQTWATHKPRAEAQASTHFDDPFLAYALFLSSSTF